MSRNLDCIQHRVHRELVAEALEHARADPDVVGLLVIGSVGRGGAYPKSDLDLLQLLNEGVERPFRTKSRDGILVECDYRTFERAYRQMQDKPMAIYYYLDGLYCYLDGLYCTIPTGG